MRVACVGGGGSLAHLGGWRVCETPRCPTRVFMLPVCIALCQAAVCGPGHACATLLVWCPRGWSQRCQRQSAKLTGDACTFPTPCTLPAASPPTPIPAHPHPRPPPPFTPCTCPCVCHCPLCLFLSAGLFHSHCIPPPPHTHTHPFSIASYRFSFSLSQFEISCLQRAPHMGPTGS
jgi:hypothetical protein